MKRYSLIIGLATVVAAIPLAAQSNGGKYGRVGDNGVYDRNGDGRIDSRDRTQGCNWWDLNCQTNGTTNGSTINNDGRWHQIGRDQSGNILYQRRTVDGNGRVVIETARRDSLGRLVIVDRRLANDNSRRVDQRIYRRGNQNDGIFRQDRRDRDDDDDRWDNRRDDGRGRWDVGKGNGRGHAYGHYKNKNKNKH